DSDLTKNMDSTGESSVRSLATKLSDTVWKGPIVRPTIRAW
ncbi:hypothetical protein AVEN_247398-1, partial [Araneus ventricosus]